MKIKKIGHSCFVVEEKDMRILFDPGNMTTAQNDLTGLNLILITHEHQDHCHIESLKVVLKNNPQVRLITNKSVGKLLGAENINYELLEHGQKITTGGVLIQAFGERHALSYPTMPIIQNTGYFVGSKLFYPGDAFYNPEKSVDILALPVAGPWAKLSEAIDYAKKINPKTCFPVHDGMLKSAGSFHKTPEIVLTQFGIKFIPLVESQEVEV